MYIRRRFPAHNRDRLHCLFFMVAIPGVGVLVVRTLDSGSSGRGLESRKGYRHNSLGKGINTNFPHSPRRASVLDLDSALDCHNACIQAPNWLTDCMLPRKIDRFNTSG